MSLQHESVEESGADGVEEPQTSADMAAVQRMLVEEGFTDWDPVVIGQLLDIAHAHATRVMKTAKTVALHCGKERVDENDVSVAIDFSGLCTRADLTSHAGGAYQSTVDRNRLLALATAKNENPLPAIRNNFGLKLPNDRFCLLQPNYVWKTETPPSNQEQVARRGLPHCLDTGPIYRDDHATTSS